MSIVAIQQDSPIKDTDVSVESLPLKHSGLICDFVMASWYIVWYVGLKTCLQVVAPTALIRQKYRHYFCLKIQIPFPKMMMQISRMSASSYG